MYPGLHWKSLRISMHLMNSFGVLLGYDSGTRKERVHPLTISVNYFYIVVDWQLLKTFSALAYCFNMIPQA